jgi:hypothetical protein
MPACPRSSASPLPRRVPGETDLSVFTMAPSRVGRHRMDRSRRWLRVVRDPDSGRPDLRVVVFTADSGGRR